MEYQNNQSFAPQGDSEQPVGEPENPATPLSTPRKKFYLPIVISLVMIVFIPAVLIAFWMSEKKRGANGEETTNQISPTEEEAPRQTPTTLIQQFPEDRNQTPTPTPIVTKKPKPLLTPTLQPSQIPSPTPTITPFPSLTPIPTPIPDTTPPTFAQFPQHNGQTFDFLNMCFPMYVTDNAPGQIQVKHKLDNDAWTSWGTDFEACYSNIPNGTHVFSAQARDVAGNETSVVTDTLTIQHN